MRLLLGMKRFSLHILIFFNKGHYRSRDLNHGNKASQEFPPYGLPPNYELPYENYADQENIPPIVNAASVKGKLEFTQVPPASHVEKVVINKVPSTTQPRVLQVITSEVTPVNTTIQEGLQNVMINDDKTKNKLEVLYERLRLIEGASSYKFGDVA